MAPASTMASEPIAVALEDPDFYLHDPEATYRRLRAEAPVHWCESARAWALAKHADIRWVSQNPADCCSSRGRI